MAKVSRSKINCAVLFIQRIFHFRVVRLVLLTDILDLCLLQKQTVPETLEWKTVESNSKRLVHRIEKIDNFQGHPAALIRFRCEGIQGPCLAHVFANFLTTTKFRSMWDKSVDDVYERYPVEDLDAVNMAMGFGTYGACTKVGVGYCTTKPAFGVDSREQLTMCGINECSDGSAIIWGTEMASWHDHLLPKDTERRTRAKSHLFATTMTPTGDNTFDVEYVLQLEIGGSLPTWLTTPIIIDNVKSMFKVVDRFFGESGGALDQHLLEIQKENNSLLMTP